MSGCPVLHDKDFKGFSSLIYDVAGIHLSDVKKPLVSGRLSRRLIQHGLQDYGDYLSLVLRDAGERQIAVNLLTTNETYFFREPKHFEFLAQQIVPTLRGRGDLRVWSAASSSGEECYTIAMTLAHELGHTRFDILGSDISTRVLDLARRALYPLDDAENIPRSMRADFCLKGIGPQQGQFLIDKKLRDRVRFAQVNLNDTLPDLGSFDVIFLRNVMIYFTNETKREVLGRVLQHLRPGGWLFVSHSESLHGVTSQLHMVRPSIYRKPLGDEA